MTGVDPPSISEPNEAACELATANGRRTQHTNGPSPAKAPRQLLCGISGGMLPLSPIMSWLGWVLGVFRGRGLQIWGPIVEIPTAFATFDGFQAKFSVLVHLWWGGSGHKGWCCGRPARAWWVFRLPLALGVPWGCWGCLGASVLAQGAPQVLNPREMARLISELPLKCG